MTMHRRGRFGMLQTPNVHFLGSQRSDVRFLMWQCILCYAAETTTLSTSKHPPPTPRSSRPDRKRKYAKLRLAFTDVISNTHFFLHSFQNIEEKEAMRWSNLVERDNVYKQTMQQKLPAGSFCLAFHLKFSRTLGYCSDQRVIFWLL